MKIVKYIKSLFIDPKWQIIEVEHGNWNIENITDFGRYKTTEVSVYEIYYSKPKNEYKLEVKGYRCKSHPMYRYMVKRLNNLRNTL